MTVKKEYVLLLTGLGVSNLGNWIYLIALNLSVWHLTKSPAAVAGIYIVGPIARILCSFFAGSIIDRHNKKRLLIWSDIIRGVIICIMPFFSSIWGIYTLIFLTSMVGSFFHPSSTFMITKIVQTEDRPRFNAINSILSSGCFMIGPALSGAIIAISNTSVAMWVNAVTFFLCAWMISLLPNVEEVNEKARSFVTLSMIKSDFQQVWQFIKLKPSLRTFILLYSLALMIAYSLDSQEMSFLKDFHQVSDTVYGVIVGITGIGAILGGIAAAAFVKKISLITYIGAGFTMTLFCYFIFYFSQSLVSAIIAFIALGFFMAFSNTGYATLYQKSIPTSIMGRFGSTLSLFESVVQIGFTLLLGLFAEWFTIRLVTSIFAFLGCILAISVYVHLMKNRSSLQMEEVTE
ncbi:MFS transporter [Lysinibacillus sp. 2017]|uniref:MFS transporter n=1 Tax=unclassified Lysinibacillus TaxID=2636778 RepID=UPI000D52819B|nr:MULTISPECIES: MFS transporter [unclassified Lysinibacillus]AWE07608.1 MFS transporter [Lysinibacillus sp. 2017]TGN36771.1 MFS transporter [Lysinibacillus sp. S2017]